MERLELKFSYEKPTKNTVRYREELGEVAHSSRDIAVGTQKEIAEALGMSQEWVSKYDPNPIQPHKRSHTVTTFYGYNVWGFKDESWRHRGYG